MPEYDNTDNPSETKPLDTEDWEIAFEPYGAHPGAALMLGFNFMVLRSYLDIEPIKVHKAIDGIDRGDRGVVSALAVSREGSMKCFTD